MHARAISLFALMWLGTAACSSSDSTDGSTTADTGLPDMDGGVDDGGGQDVFVADAEPIDTGWDAGPPIPPMIIAFVANPASIDRGQTTELVWNAQRADKIGIVLSPGNFILVENSTITNGILTTPPLDETSMFTLTASNTFGSDSRTIFVGVDPGDPEIVSYTASPNPAPLNGTSTLNWRTRNATRVRILAGATVLYDSPNTVMTGTWETPPLTEATNAFTLEASNFAHLTTRLLIVTTQ